MSERTLHRAVCDYIRMAYPYVIFNTDLSGAIKLTVGQAVALKSLRSGRGFPDITIYEPCKGFHGMFLELKQDGTPIYRQNGKMATPHIQEQWDMICKLNDLGYYAKFAIGIDDAIKQIDWYLQ